METRGLAAALRSWIAVRHPVLATKWSLAVGMTGSMRQNPYTIAYVGPSESRASAMAQPTRHRTRESRPSKDLLGTIQLHGTGSTLTGVT